MKKLFPLITLTFSLLTFSQKSDFWQNTRFGGGFSFGFGSNNTTIAISPVGVYDFNEELSLGASVGYLYNKQNDYSANVYSVGALALYKPIREIEFSTDLKQLYVNRSFGSLEDNYSYPTLNLGAAYVTGRVSLGIQYDVLYDENKSIYASAISPVIRILF